MNRPTIRTARQPFSELTRSLGKRILHVRLYREIDGFLCERELVEPDGTGITLALPFHTAKEVEEFLLADPHFVQIKRGATKLLDSVAQEVGDASSSPTLPGRDRFS